MKLKKRNVNNGKIRRIIMVGVFAIVITSVLIGYAVLAASLKFNGTVTASATSWDVHFEDIVVTEGSVTPTTAATISENTTINFNATLPKPGDFYEFTVKVKNGGNVNAMISEIIKTPELTPEQAAYLSYTATYKDGGAIEAKDKLLGSESQTIKIRVEYRTDLEASDLPKEAQSFDLAYTLDYIQADKTAKDPTLTA